MLSACEGAELWKEPLDFLTQLRQEVVLLKGFLGEFFGGLKFGRVCGFLSLLLFFFGFFGAHNMILFEVIPR